MPYRGAGPALNDLMAGHIDIMFDQATNSLPQARAGKVKAYAVTAPSRLPSAPDIPTVDEAGVPGLHVAYLARCLGAQGHPGGHRRETQCSDQSGVGRACSQGEFLELGQEISSQDKLTPAACDVIRSKRLTNGGRSSRRPISRRSRSLDGPIGGFRFALPTPRCRTYPKSSFVSSIGLPCGVRSEAWSQASR